MNRTLELKQNQTIVFIGDSITDADRCEPAYRPFGFGYVHFIANTLLAKYPALNLNIINRGISGNTIRNLKSRWKTDCIKYEPNILTVLIGINDLLRRYGGSEKVPHAVYPDEYESIYRELLSMVKQQCNCQIVLMEPFMFCNNQEDRIFKRLQTYISTADRLAKEFDAILVPLQNKLDKQLKQVSPERWSDDSVHPYLWAHAWISQCWFEITNL